MVGLGHGPSTTTTTTGFFTSHDVPPSGMVWLTLPHSVPGSRVVWSSILKVKPTAISFCLARSNGRSSTSGTTFLTAGVGVGDFFVFDGVAFGEAEGVLVGVLVGTDGVVLVLIGSSTVGVGDGVCLGRGGRVVLSTVGVESACWVAVVVGCGGASPDMPLSATAPAPAPSTTAAAMPAIRPPLRGALAARRLPPCRGGTVGGDCSRTGAWAMVGCW
jgi:hypothetical protein